MRCSNCGAQMRDGLAFCTSCGTSLSAPVPGVEQAAYQPPVQPRQQPRVEMAPARKKKKAPGPAGRVLLRLASVLICLCLGLSLLVTAVVIDLHRLTSQKQLRKTVESILTPADAVGPAPLAVMGLALEEPSEESMYEMEVSLDISTDELVDMVYDALEEEYGEELTVTKSQLRRFYEESTLKDRLSEKVAAYMTDVIQGTDDTQITKRDIVDVIEENEDLIEDVFHVRVDGAMRQEVLQFINVEELNDAIRTQVILEVQEAELGGMSVEELMEILRGWSSGGVMWALIIVDILLIGLLFLTNWGRVASALRCASIPMICVGVLLAIPTLIAQLLVGGQSILDVLICSLLGVIAPVHYIMLLLGVLLLIGSFVVKIFVKLAEE